MTQDIIKSVTQRIYDAADEADWTHLTIYQRKNYYEAWTSDPQIGGRLEQIMDPNRVRVYLKDTVMRNYMRSRRLSIQELLGEMSISFKEISQEFIKPQAVLCDGVSMYTLTAAKEWKNALMSAFERGCEVPGLERNMVFLTDHTTGQFVDGSYRDLIAAAAKRLDLKIHWIT